MYTHFQMLSHFGEKCIFFFIFRLFFCCALKLKSGYCTQFIKLSRIIKIGTVWNALKDIKWAKHCSSHTESIQLPLNCRMFRNKIDFLKPKSIQFTWSPYFLCEILFDKQKLLFTYHWSDYLFRLFIFKQPKRSVCIYSRKLISIFIRIERRGSISYCSINDITYQCNDFQFSHFMEFDEIEYSFLYSISRTGYQNHENCISAA